MRVIIKGKEPKELKDYREKPNSCYDGIPGPVKDKIRDSILKEQGHLCAYCMQRINPNNMKIEHWHSQTRHEEEQLDYMNLLACCMGNEGQPLKNQHCDIKKQEQDISFNPANPNHQQRLKIRYLGDGTIFSDNQAFNDEIDTILNLNWIRLKQNRKVIVDNVMNELNNKPGLRTKREIKKLVNRWNAKNSNGHHDEYCAVALYFLEKKLQRI